MKKLINDPNRVVEEMIEGLLAIYPGLARLGGYNVLVRADFSQTRDLQVALISGGGSGHEPAHAGFVGPGMLSAAVAGEVFTSPTPESVFAAISAVAGPLGALLIVKNYTGDRLNFGVAAEMARAQGIPVEIVIVADDVALASVDQHAGARGIAGTVLVHKIAGAAAAEGKPLAEVAALAEAAAQSVSSMGVSLSSGIVPAVAKPSFTLPEGEVELGLGIHGEPGVRRVRLRSADRTVEDLLEPILSAQHSHYAHRIALLVNNLGSTTPMELAIVARHAVSTLAGRSLKVERVYAGTFMSSLEMAGVSLSVLRLDDERLRLLDAPTLAPAWPVASAQPALPVWQRVISTSNAPALSIQPPETAFGKSAQQAIEAACSALILAEERLTELDRIVGDGDLGLNMARAARVVKRALPTFPLDSPSGTLNALAESLRQHLGGSSGPLYGILFLRAATALEDCTVDAADTWAQAAIDACEAVSKLGGALAGDRTMLDALIPFATTFRMEIGQNHSIATALRAAVEAAETGAHATAQMHPRKGRSSYIGDRALGTPDPGAIAVSIWLRAVESSLNHGFFT
ncbi:MAG TPA: dihydroxyacetone kinase subunit DhaL [Bryobacteraceae bacterium]|jgi:dihydroxyacetone kinase|nr:dihydroxyacetone kinase subunit DhaL [Bryobacteraceae bacterium]